MDLFKGLHIHTRARAFATLTFELEFSVWTFRVSLKNYKHMLFVITPFDFNRLQAKHVAIILTLSLSLSLSLCLSHYLSIRGLNPGYRPGFNPWSTPTKD